MMYDWNVGSATAYPRPAPFESINLFFSLFLEFIYLSKKNGNLEKKKKKKKMVLFFVLL